MIKIIKQNTKKIISLTIALFMLFGTVILFTACGKKYNPVPNVMGIDHSEAKKVLENAGFEVTEIEADAGSILPNTYDDRSVNQGQVFKVNNETDFDYDDNEDMELAHDSKVTIYYAKEDYTAVVQDDSDSDYDMEDEEVTKNTQVKSTKSKSADNINWKQFLKEYEEWVDSYIELLKKYKDNPTDMSILSEYTEQMNKVSEWSEKAEKIEADLANNPDDLKEYLDTLSRIIKKLSEVDYN